MRILIIVWEFPPGPGGIGQHAFSLAVALQKKGCDVNVITSADYARPHEVRLFDERYTHLNIRRVKRFSFITYISRLLMITRVIAGLRPEQVILSGRSSLWLVNYLKVIFSWVKVICFLHGSEVHKAGGALNRVTVKSLKKMDKIFAVSLFTKRLIPTDLIKPERVEVLPNGLNLDMLPKLSPEFYLPIYQSGMPRLLTVGNVSKRKGQHRVIKVLPHLAEIWPDIHYHIVGLDNNKGELIELARKLKVEDKITFHGRMESRATLYSAYCSASIFIMLSENQQDGDVEGFGIAILEANFFGLPAIGAKYCGIEDAISEGFNGYLVDGDDPAEITNAIKVVLDSYSMSEQAKTWAQNHDWDLLIDKVLSK